MSTRAPTHRGAASSWIRSHTPGPSSDFGSSVARLNSKPRPAATLHANVSSQRERILSFVPIETIPLPRPLSRFGTAFPTALADVYASAYTPRRGVVLDPLAHPWS